MNAQNRWPAGLLGYLIDLFRLGRGLPINLHSMMKYMVIRALARRTGANCLVETGTFLGVTAARCAGVFDTVLTVELDPQLAAQATKFLAKYANVTVYQGDAVSLLPKMLAHRGATKTIVFLDAHFSGGDTAHGDVPEPAIAELSILAKHADHISGIIIDDFRSFGVDEGFPTKAELLAVAEAHFFHPTFAIKAHCDQIVIERIEL
jgi:hypothetical protein